MGMRTFIPTLTDEENEIFIKSLKPLKSNQGSLIIEMGDSKQDIYFLLDGQFAIYKKLEVAGVTIAVKLADIKAPVIFGETNLFLKQKRTAAVLVSSEKAHYYCLPIEDFEKIKDEHPSLGIKILEVLGKITTERYTQFQDCVYEKLIESAQTGEEALVKVEDLIGPSYLCSRELAQKLFSLNNDPHAFKRDDQSLTTAEKALLDNP